MPAKAGTSAALGTFRWARDNPPREVRPQSSFGKNKQGSSSKPWPYRDRSFSPNSASDAAVVFQLLGARLNTEAPILEAWGWFALGGLPFDLDVGIVALGLRTRQVREIVATAKELRQIAHVFTAVDKNLGALVEASGSELNALRSLQAAANRALAEGRLAVGPNGILPGRGLGVVLRVNGVNVQLIGGRVLNGVVELGSLVGR